MVDQKIKSQKVISMYTINDPNASYRLLQKDAANRGYTFREFKLGGSRMIEFRHPHKSVWLTPISNINYPINYSYGVKVISKNKSLSYEFAEKNDIRIPYTHVLGPEETITESEWKLLQEKYKNLVVKPESSSLGRGVTLNIHTYNQLTKALEFARSAKSFSPNILVQEQFEGEEVRFIVLGGEVVTALLRRAARLVGDGKRTIRELAMAENQERRALHRSMAEYPQLEKICTDKEFLYSDEILSKGKIKELNRSTMISGGASIYNILNQVHPSYIEIAKKYALNMNAGFIAVDLIIQDYTQNANNTNHWFNESNNAPVLKLFYSFRDGNNYDIVPKLMDRIDIMLGLNYPKGVITKEVIT